MVEVASRAGAAKAVLVRTPGDIPWHELEEAETVGLSAGASAPEILVDQMIEAFHERYDLKVELVETVKEDEEFLVARDLRDTELTPDDMSFVNGPVQ